jgi:hypothetical protein
MRNIYTPTAFAGSTTTVIGIDNVFVHTVIIPKTSAGTITLEASDGTDYFVFPSSTVAGTYIFDATFASGLKITTSGADVGVVNFGQ